MLSRRKATPDQPTLGGYRRHTFADTAQALVAHVYSTLLAEVSG